MNETYEIVGDCGRLIFHDFGCNGVPKCNKGDNVFDIHGMEWNRMEWNRMEWNGMERYNTYSHDIVLYLVHFYNIIIIYIYIFSRYGGNCCSL